MDAKPIQSINQSILNLKTCEKQFYVFTDFFYQILTEKEYKIWKHKYQEASLSTENRDQKLLEVICELECNLDLLGLYILHIGIVAWQLGHPLDDWRIRGSNQSEQT